jgi:serine/threonine protein kinase
MLAMSYAPPYEVKLPCYCKDNCSSCGTPREGDLKIVANHHLRVNESTDYIVTHFLGRGVFGQVVQAFRCQTGKTYAIKVLKNTPSYYEQGKTELNVLLRLLKYGAERQPVAYLVEAFELTGHLCLVFELYRENLYEYLKKNRFTPLSVSNIRYIGFQLLQALDFLLLCKVIHTDIKPENIMLTSGNREFEIKLIDFGSAVVTDRPAIECCYLQSRYYRSPEVLVRSEITTASDMFSVGCVLAELYIGYPLMAGNNEYEQLRLIIEMIGPLPNNLIASGKSGTRFFNFFLGNDNQVIAMLKPEEQIDRMSVFKEKRKQCHNIRNLNEMQYYKRSSHYDENSPSLFPAEYERFNFADLLARMLCTDPKRRIIPQVAKCHNFFSSYDAAAINLQSHVATSPQMLQMAAAQQQSQNALNQYLPALTTIYQQLTFIPPPVAAIAQQQPMAFMPTAAIFPNPAALQSFGHVIQQLIAPANQYAQLAAAAPTFPLMTNQSLNQQPQISQQQQQQILLAQPQPQLMIDPQQFCYQLQARPPSRSRSPL